MTPLSYPNGQYLTLNIAVEPQGGETSQAVKAKTGYVNSESAKNACKVALKLLTLGGLAYAAWYVVRNNQSLPPKKDFDPSKCVSKAEWDEVKKGLAQSCKNIAEQNLGANLRSVDNNNFTDSTDDLNCYIYGVPGSAAEWAKLGTDFKYHEGMNTKQNPRIAFDPASISPDSITTDHSDFVTFADTTNYPKIHEILARNTISDSRCLAVPDAFVNEKLNRPNVNDDTFKNQSLGSQFLYLKTFVFDESAADNKGSNSDANNDASKSTEKTASSEQSQPAAGSASGAPAGAAPTESDAAAGAAESAGAAATNAAANEGNPSGSIPETASSIPQTQFAPPPQGQSAKLAEGGTSEEAPFVGG